jgi:WD40 repeat protein
LPSVRSIDKMMLCRFFLTGLFATHFVIVFSQTTKNEVEKWKALAAANEERAVRAEKLADQFKRLSEEADRNARRTTYLYSANELALRSLQIPDRELAALLALQAHNFNVANKGFQFNNRIFDGISSALKRYDKFGQTLGENDVKCISSDWRGSSIFSLTKHGQLLRWFQKDGTWTNEEIARVSPEGLTGILASSSAGNVVAIEMVKLPTAKTSYVELVKLADKSRSQVSGFTSRIDKLIFTPDGRGFFALCNSGRTLMYSDLRSLKEVAVMEEEILSIDLNEEGTKLFGASAQGNILVWNTGDYTSVKHQILPNSTGLQTIKSVPISDDRVICTSNGEIRFVSLVDGKTLRVLSFGNSKILSIEFSPGGKLFATKDETGVISIWDLRNILGLPRIISSGPGTGIFFSPDDTKILTIENSQIKSWPFQVDKMAQELCGCVSRNLTAYEWETYIDNEFPIEKTCPAR